MSAGGLTRFLSTLSAGSPALFSIPAGRPFLDDLIKPLVAASVGVPEELAALTIFLPTRRAVRSAQFRFSAALLAEDRDAALLLPRLRALGDVAEEDLLFTGTVPPEALELPPAAPGSSRRAALARLVRAYYKDELSWAGCLSAADTLAGLLDSFHLEDVDTDALETAIPETMAQTAASHWGTSLEFLKIIRTVWPAILAENGWIDAADRQTRLLRALARQTAATENTGAPIIMAGSLGTVKATGALMSAIAHLPNGLVILPGVDLEMDDTAWQAIDPPHPQALIRERLEREFEGVSREVIKRWPGAEADDGGEQRRSLISLALRPARATADWPALAAAFSDDAVTAATQGLTTVEAANENEEASFIALKIREALDVPSNTVLMVTPDRELARRVAMKLQAWSIEVDDTGGVPLSGTFRGGLVRLIAAWANDPSSPVCLTALFSHSLVQLGLARRDWEPLRRWLNRALRGRRKAWSFDALRAYWADAAHSPLPEDRRGEAGEVLAAMAQLHARFLSCRSVADWIGALCVALETLCATDDEAGAARAWRYEDGEALAALFDDLLTSDAWADVQPPDTEFRDILKSLLQPVVVRKRGGHPRLTIVGSLEARLQSADVVILAGLNDGVWPDMAPTDAFLSPPMRAAVGLPSPEQSIGRSAHDFSMLASSPNVLLSWSAKRGGEPARPSRWITRLQTILAHRGSSVDLDETTALRRLHHLRDVPTSTAQPAERPVFTPPRDARPTVFSVSDIETLIRDPYAVYAKRVLRLYPMERAEAPIDAKERGILFHHIAEIFARMFPTALPRDVGAALEQIITQSLATLRLPEGLRVECGEDFRRFTERFSRYEATVRQHGGPLALEAGALWRLALAGGTEVRLKGRADRIDRDGPNGYAIVDFKSSGNKQPTEKSAKAFSPQLMLLALMGQNGAFADVPALAPSWISYVNLLGKSSEPVISDKHTLSGEALAAELPLQVEKLKELLTLYIERGAPFFSKPRPAFQTDHGDYDHLARRAEWSAADD